MEDMKKEQLEVLYEAKGYCTNVLHCIDTVVPELKGDKKDDTDEYLRMTVDGVNVVLEMFILTSDLSSGVQPVVDDADGNIAVKELSAALKSSDDSAKADALVKVRAFIAQFKDCAEAVCK